MAIKNKTKRFLSSLVLISFSMNLLPCQLIAVGSSNAGDPLTEGLLDEGHSASGTSCWKNFLRRVPTRKAPPQSVELDTVEQESTGPGTSSPEQLQPVEANTCEEEAPPPITSLAEQFLTSLGARRENLDTALPLLEDLLKVELSGARTFFRWVNINHLIQNILCFIVLDREGFLTAQKKQIVSPRYWMQGRALPLQSLSTWRRAAFLEGLCHGVETALFTTLHYYAVINFAVRLFEGDISSSCSQTLPVICYIQLFFNSEGSYLRRGIEFLGGNVGAAAGILAFLVMARGLYGGFSYAVYSDHDPQTIGDALDQMHPSKNTFWNTCVSVIPMHRFPRKRTMVERLLLWRPDLPRQARLNLFETLENLVGQKWYAPILGLSSMARVVHAAHAQDLLFLKNHDVLSTEQVEQWLRVKARALTHLKEQASCPQKRKLLYRLYAHYLLWSLGLKVAWSDFLLWGLFKGVKLASQLALARTIILSFL